MQKDKRNGAIDCRLHEVATQVNVRKRSNGHPFGHFDVSFSSLSLILLDFSLHALIKFEL